jgi:hypothetical protein
MSSSTKGAGLERKAKELLESQGYLVHRTVRTPIMRGGKVIGSHNNDVFGVFDLLAMRGGWWLTMVQVTTATNIAARAAKVAAISDYFPIDVDIEVWGWVGGAKRIDKRFTKEKRYVRRQYWRVLRWDPASKGWEDITNPDDGWEDHGGAAPDA